MGSSASVWVLNVAIFSGAIPRRRCAEGSLGKPRSPARLRQRVPLGEPRMSPADVWSGHCLLQLLHVALEQSGEPPAGGAAHEVLGT